MLAALMSLPSQVKDLLDRLDAAITSRGQPTAKSPSTDDWSSERAGYLENIKVAPLSIKGIQRGTVSVKGPATSGTATITSVDPSKTELRLLGHSDGLDHPLRIALTDATTITATRDSVNTNTSTASWELTEYN